MNTWEEQVIVVDDDDDEEEDLNVNRNAFLRTYGRNENFLQENNIEGDRSSVCLDYSLDRINKLSLEQNMKSIDNAAVSEPSSLSVCLLEENLKPPSSYRELIAEVFSLVGYKPLELCDIYSVITANFPYYQPGGAWQSAVRHVLFSDPTFVSDPATNMWRMSSIPPSSQLPTSRPQSIPISSSRHSYNSPLSMNNNFSNNLQSVNSSRPALGGFNKSTNHTISSIINSEPRVSASQMMSSTISSEGEFGSGCSYSTGSVAPVVSSKYSGEFSGKLSHSPYIPPIQTVNLSQTHDLFCDKVIHAGSSDLLAPSKSNSHSSFLDGNVSNTLGLNSPLSVIHSENTLSFSPTRPFSSSLNMHELYTIGSYSTVPNTVNHTFGSSIEPVSSSGSKDTEKTSPDLLVELKSFTSSGDSPASSAIRNFREVIQSSSLQTDLKITNNTQTLASSDCSYMNRSVAAAVSPGTSVMNEDNKVNSSHPILHGLLKVQGCTSSKSPILAKSVESLEKESTLSSCGANYSEAENGLVISTKPSLPSNVYRPTSKITDIIAVSRSPVLSITNENLQESHTESVDNSKTLARVSPASATKCLANNINNNTEENLFSSLENRSSSSTECIVSGIERNKSNWELSLHNINSGLEALKNKLNRKSCEEYSTSDSAPPQTSSVETSASSKTISASNFSVIMSNKTNTSRDISENSTYQKTSIVDSPNLPKTMSLGHQITDTLTKPTIPLVPSEKTVCSTNIDNREAVEDCSHFLKKMDFTAANTVTEVDTVVHASEKDGGSETETTSTDSSDDEQQAPVAKKVKRSGPLEVKGYTKPSYSFPQLITQALAICPKRQATAMQICDIISEKQPYYKYIPSHWKGCVYSALAKRKKFFVIVETNEDGAYIWSFNPTFEQYMLNKWVPKYLRKKTELENVVESEKVRPSIIKNVNTLRAPTDPVIEKPEDLHLVIVSSASLRPVEPVIVSSGSLRSINTFTVSSESLRSSSGHPMMMSGTSLETEDLTLDTSSTDSSPEFALADPDQTWGFDEDTVQAAKPWEPVVTVSENAGFSETQRAVNSITETQDEVESVPTVDKEAGNLNCKDTFQNEELRYRCSFDAAASRKSNKSKYADFMVDNFNREYTALKGELQYRRSFSTEHHGIQKFRLHCTVCDVHLGTAGVVAQNNVRLHAWLAVLTCARCYRVTSSAALPVASVCHWCARLEGVHFRCSSCPLKFCETCVKRNFGTNWFFHIALKKKWLCFICDMKQIWPHRAIAYFLLVHYNRLKKEKMHMARMKNSWKPEDFQFFTEDLSTCCKGTTGSEWFGEELNFSSTELPTEVPVKPLIETVTALPLPILPQTEGSSPPDNEDHQALPVSTSEPQSIVIENNPPKHIYVQTSTGVSSLTLNTGTQYIHNVYPDKSYVVMHPPNTNNTAQSTTLSNVQSQSKSSANRSVLQNPSLNVLSSSTGIPFGKHLKVPSIKQVTTSTNIPTSSAYPPDEQVISGEGISTGPNHRPSDRSNSKTHELTAREMIERKPMPKSKKQSLLRTVLMSESIESMKRNLQIQGDHSTHEATPPEPHQQDNTSVPQSNMSGAEQNVEEPILKSIIQTATERLLGLKKRLHLTKSASTGNICTESTSVIDLDAEELVDSSFVNSESTLNKETINTTTPSHVPKIKIRTLQELQEPEEKVNTINEPNKIKDCNISFAAKPVHMLEKQPKEVDVTDLKRGIIEASRTLVSTQKKLKELAKVISSNLSYRTEEAVELITKFQNILKSCQNQVYGIDTNICNQFGSLVPNILETIKRPSEVEVSNSSIVLSKKKQRMKQTEILQNRSVPFTGKSVEKYTTDVFLSGSNKTDPTIPPQWQIVGVEAGKSGWGDGSRFERLRDLVDFNPMGKKVILGSPEITPEDLEQIPNIWDSTNAVSVPESESVSEPLTRQHLLKKQWKKKNIWITKKRKKYNKDGTVRKKIYNKDGTVRKKIGRPSNSSRWAEAGAHEYGDLSQSKLSEKQNIERLRKRIKNPPVPLRLSERRHPSSVEYVARFLSSSSEESVPVWPVKYEIKPCSVVIHRLSQRIEQLLQKKF